MDKLGKLAEYFETYRGHDQILSLLGYNFTMLSGLYPKKSSKHEKLVILATQIVNCRTILRFLDDFSMLHYTLSYGFGKHEPYLIVRWCNLINNIVSQIYYPIEHIAWLADNKILSFSSAKFWLISTLTWLISSLASIICNFIAIMGSNAFKDKDFEFKYKRLNRMQVKIILQIIKDISYCILAIHWLPPGFLWSGKLSNFQSGLFGVIANLCGIIKTIV